MQCDCENPDIHGDVPCDKQPVANIDTNTSSATLCSYCMSQCLVDAFVNKDTGTIIITPIREGGIPPLLRKLDELGFEPESNAMALAQLERTSATLPSVEPSATLEYQKASIGIALAQARSEREAAWP